jgi:RNA polymerase sigma-70 factor (ECF subfamily)
MSDAEVMALSCRDPGRFGVVFDRYFVAIHRYVARRIGSDGADDLAGEVFRIAFERRDAFDPRWANARPWLYGIATNLLRGQRRGEERRLRAMLRATAAACVPMSADVFERASERIDAQAAAALIGSAVGQLTQRDRDALVLFAVEGLSYPEVAVALDIPVGTVRSRISRARCRLRELLDANGQQLSDWPEAGEDRSG